MKKDLLNVSPSKKGNMPEKRESAKRLSNSPNSQSEKDSGTKSENKPNPLAGLGIKPNKSLHSDIKAKLAAGIKAQMSSKKINVETPNKGVGSDKDMNTPSSLKKPVKFGQDSGNTNGKS